MNRLEGKVCLVTGGAAGIGRAIVERFASEGAKMVVACDVNPCEYTEPNVVGKILNVTDREGIKALVKEIVEEYGPIDVLVNNAGITKDGLLMRMKEEDFDKVIDINLKGVFNVTKAATKFMMKKKYGRVINMSSVVGVVGNAGQANYCASKAGVIGFTKAVAKELASRNININAIAPGFIETDMTDVLSDDLKGKMLEQIPKKCIGNAENIADTALFLASDMSSYITGQVINVDGGMVM